MTAGIQYLPLSNDLYSIPKAQLLFREQGSASFDLLGDSDEVTIEVAVEELERFTNETGTKQLAKTFLTQIDATVNMTLVQLSDRNRALSLLSQLNFKVQDAAVGNTLSLVTPVHENKIYILNGDIDLSNVVVTDGDPTPVPYVEGVDYEIDTSAGFIQLIQAPGGSDGDVEIVYDVAAILAADKRSELGIANKSENRGTLVIRGTNAVGPRLMVTLHDVQLRPDAERNYVSPEDLDTMELVGRVFRDETQAAGFELGVEQRLL